jgi:hypothetical protein
MLEGRVDEWRDGTIYGWAVDRNALSERLKIVAIHQGNEVASTTADLYREDLGLNSVGDGKHAFQLPLEYVQPIPTIVARNGDGEQIELVPASDLERQVERLFDAHKVRFERSIRAIERALKEINKAKSTRADELAERQDQNSEVLERILQRVKELETRVESYEVFVMRVDRTLAEIKSGLSVSGKRGFRLGRTNSK